MASVKRATALLALVAIAIAIGIAIDVFLELGFGLTPAKTFDALAMAAAKAS